MAGGTCDCGGPGLESMSTKDLMALERIMAKGDPGTAMAIHEVLRKRRVEYARLAEN
jgi:hypothetical protein